MAAAGDSGEQGDRLDPDEPLRMARTDDPPSSDDVGWPDYARQQSRRVFLWWAVPIVLVITAAVSVKILSEILGEPAGLETLALVLAFGVGAYFVAWMAGYLLYAAFWAPIAHALGWHQRPCPSCGLSTDFRDPRCRHCHRPLRRPRKRRRRR